MMIIKRIISLVLISFMLICTIAFANNYSDVEGNKYEKAINIITSLDLMKGYKDNQFKPDDKMTRAELTTVISSLLGIYSNEQVQESEAKFYDVPNWHWAASSVYAVESMGIIKGYNDGSFKPEQDVTYDQILKMFIHILGYESYAYLKGGYPAGYLIVANEKGITRNVASKGDEGLTRGKVAQIIYNCLHAEVITQINHAGRLELTSDKDNTLLYVTKRIKREKGLIKTNEYTSIDRNIIPKRNTATIGDTSYKFKNNALRIKANDWLGYYVEFYYHEDNDRLTNTIVYMEQLENKNTVISIKAQELIDFKNNTYQYWDEQHVNGKMMEKKIEKSTAVIYNGKLSSFDNVNFTPDSGEVELIDWGSGYIDVVKIKDYTTHVVHKVDKLKNIVYSKYGMDALELNAQDSKADISIVNMQGEELALNDLKEWDVLSVAISRDRDFIFIKVSDKSVEGVVKETAGDRAIIIGEEEFKLADSYNGRMVNIGDAITAYLNVEGKIAGIDFMDSDTTWIYAYALKFGFPAQGVERNLQIKLFNEQGSIQIIECAKKVTVDNVPISDHTNVLNILSNTDKVIRYQLNSEGKINSIDTVTLNTQMGEGEDTLIKIYPEKEHAYKKLPYKPSSRTFGGKILINDKTKVLYIPSGDDPEDKDFKIISNLDYFYNDMEPLVAGYTTKKNSAIAKLLVTYQEAGGGLEVDKEEQLAIVEKITLAISEEGEPLKKLYAYKDGILMCAYAKHTENGTIIDNIDVGDTIHFSVDNDNIITALDIIYDVSTGVFNDKADNRKTPPHFTYNIFRVVFGSVYSMDDDIIRVIVGRKEDNGDLIDITDTSPENLELINNLDHIENYNPNYFKIYLYDGTKSNNKVTLGGISDIMDYMNFPNEFSRVIVQTRTGESRTIIIYNGLTN